METVEVIAVCIDNLGERRIVLFRLKNHEPIGTTDTNHMYFTMHVLKDFGWFEEIITFDKFDNSGFIEQAIDLCDMMFVYDMKSDESIRILEKSLPK